MALSGATF
jgi:hypothetical protein